MLSNFHSPENLVLTPTLLTMFTSSMRVIDVAFCNDRNAFALRFIL